MKLFNLLKKNFTSSNLILKINKQKNIYSILNQQESILGEGNSLDSAYKDYLNNDKNYSWGMVFSTYY